MLYHLYLFSSLYLEELGLIYILEKLDRYWKVWMFLPVILLIISSFIIIDNIARTGSFMQRDVELSGGKMITLRVSDVDVEKLAAAFPYASFHVTRGAATNLLVQIPADMDEKNIIKELSAVIVIEGEPSISMVNPVLSDIFWKQAQLALIVAFAAMAVFVFVLFRSPVPCSIVILAAATDIVSTIAIISMIGVKLSMPVLAALVMIIGYSVDTDILLTSSLLKKSGEIKHRIKNAMKTGMTMSLTAVVAMLMMYLISGSFVLEQIALVLMIGILIDIPATWLTNAGLLRWWIEKRKSV